MKYEGNSLRHELKYYINESVYHTLRNRLKMVINPDSNMKSADGYLITSIYFDDIYKTAMNEKISGARFRKKFRIRAYERDDSLIKLECKSKFDEYISKVSTNLSREEYDFLLSGNYDFLFNRSEKVCKELLVYNRINLLKPVVTVEYQREAYILNEGNVRITFDKDISASTGSLNMFDESFATTKVLPEKVMVLEVKYDNYLPSNVHSLLRTAMTEKCAISKYVMCRENKRRNKYI